MNNILEIYDVYLLHYIIYFTYIYTSLLGTKKVIQRIHQIELRRPVSFKGVGAGTGLGRLAAGNAQLFARELQSLLEISLDMWQELT